MRLTKALLGTVLIMAAMASQADDASLRAQSFQRDVLKIAQEKDRNEARLNALIAAENIANVVEAAGLVNSDELQENRQKIVRVRQYFGEQFKGRELALSQTEQLMAQLPADLRAPAQRGYAESAPDALRRHSAYKAATYEFLDALNAVLNLAADNMGHIRLAAGNTLQFSNGATMDKYNQLMANARAVLAKQQQLGRDLEAAKPDLSKLGKP